jgi:antitoxin ParD1/3/4
MDVKLSPELEKRIAEHVARQGQYASAEVFVEQAVVAQLEAEESDARLEALMAQGLESGPATEMTREDWAEIRGEAMKQHEMPR